MDTDIPKEFKKEKVPISLANTNMLPILLALLIGLFFIVIFYVIKKRGKSRKDFLLTGISDSGKTTIFSQIINAKACETFTSITENIGDYQCGTGAIRIVDIPGNERVRSKYFDEYKNTTKGVIFIVDSVTIQKDIRDVADYLYTILTDSAISPCQVLILCNKQDETMAKGPSVIKTILEKEINLVRKTRSTKLQSVDDSEARTEFLGKLGTDFEFSHINQNIQILECSAKKNDLNNLTDWIDRMV